MSKVHEALKRAEEERANQPRNADLVSGSDNGTAHSSSSDLKTSEKSHQLDAIKKAQASAPNQTEFVTEQPSGNGANPNVAAVEPVPLPGPSMRLVGDHRPVGPMAGRDPRTGQFLRFEDLLKSCTAPIWVHDPQKVVFSAAHHRIACAEQFRTLRSRLYQLREAVPLKKILITSALASEGKTFVATNLAQAIAQEKERKVLLIDADLRSPALHKPLGASAAPGLADYLRGHASDPEIIQHGQPGNLCFIPAGTSGSDTSELLSNGGLEKLLDRLAPLFDWVVVDSPPCLPVSDANVLAGLCDGVLMVLRARSTPSAAATKARKELQQRKLIGVVMNAVEELETYGSYYGYGHTSNGNDLLAASGQ